MESFCDRRLLCKLEQQTMHRYVVTLKKCSLLWFVRQKKSKMDILQGT